MFTHSHNYFQNVKPLLADEKAIRKIGFWGYLVGIFSLFISMRLAEIAVGSYISFLFFFSISLILNYGESAMTALFLDMLGHKGSSSALFYLFGFAHLLWLFLLPLIFIGKFMNFHIFPFFLAVFLGIIFLKLKLIKETFCVKYKTAIISFSAPYVLVCTVSIFALIYSFYWLSQMLG